MYIDAWFYMCLLIKLINWLDLRDVGDHLLIHHIGQHLLLLQALEALHHLLTHVLHELGDGGAVWREVLLPQLVLFTHLLLVFLRPAFNAQLLLSFTDWLLFVCWSFTCRQHLRSYQDEYRLVTDRHTSQCCHWENRQLAPWPHISVTLSWHWANQALLYLNTIERLARKWQVYNF